MRILLIHQYFLEDHEGGGSRWNEMSRIWIGEGHTVTVLAGTAHYMTSNVTRPVNYIDVKTNIDGVRIIRCRVWARGKSTFAGRIWGYLSFVFSSVWGGIFYSKEKYDLIIVTSPPLFIGITALALSFWKKIPFVLEIRDLWPESAIDTGILKNRLFIRLSFTFEKCLYKKAKLINVLTPAFRNVLIDKKDVEKEKVIYIPNAADFHLSEQTLTNFDRNGFREKLGLEGHFVVIYVGAHGFANHLIQVIEAAEILKKTNAFFLLIGDGAQKSELILETEKRGLKNVRFMGSVPKEEIFKFIIASDIGASVLKKAEIFKTVYSNKTFDYFSCKMPVLMAIDGISKQMVEEADAGIFVEPECPLDFAAKVEFYMNNRKLLIAQGENGYRYGKAHFDRNFLAKKYLNHLEFLVKPD